MLWNTIYAILSYPATFSASLHLPLFPRRRKQPPNRLNSRIPPTKHDPDIPPLLAPLPLHHPPKPLIEQHGRQPDRRARLNHNLHPLQHQPQRRLDLPLRDGVHSADFRRVADDGPRDGADGRAQAVGDGEGADARDARPRREPAPRVVGALEAGLGAEDGGAGAGEGRRDTREHAAAAAGGDDGVETPPSPATPPSILIGIGIGVGVGVPIAIPAHTPINTWPRILPQYLPNLRLHLQR